MLFPDVLIVVGTFLFLLLIFGLIPVSIIAQKKVKDFYFEEEMESAKKNRTFYDVEILSEKEDDVSRQNGNLILRNGENGETAQ